MEKYPDGQQSLVSRFTCYLELTRIHKPAGVLYIYFAYLYGSMLGFSIQDPVPSIPSTLRESIFLIFIGFLIRSIGCTWNDIVDREFDKSVARCSSRPLARGAISIEAAFAFLAFEYTVLFLAMSAFTSSACSIYLALVIISGTLYPYAKRYTNYAQLILGISLSLGVFLGSTIAGADPIMLRGSKTGWSLLSLAASYVCWTIVYDTIYACQDKEEDKKLGLKTMAIRFEHYLRPTLRTFSLMQLVLLLVTGYLFDAGWMYLVGICCTAMTLCLMVEMVDLEDPKSCWRWFKYGSLSVGGSVSLALCGEYAVRSLRATP